MFGRICVRLDAFTSTKIYHIFVSDVHTWRFYYKVFVLDKVWTSSWVQLYGDCYWIFIL